MSMITEEVTWLRELADRMSRSTFIHENIFYVAMRALKEAADTIEQLAAKVRAENNVSQPCEDDIPIPKNATNGEILCSIFPDMHYTLSEKTPRVVTTIGVASSFDIDWWNSPYKRGDKK